jgi:DNA-binding NarL/FixJ family response regulator
MAETTQVFIVDDHPLVREWLSMLLAQQSDMRVCGEAADAAVALSRIEQARPDVAIVDLALASGSGLELLKDIRRVSPGTLCLVLSMHDEQVYAERALRAGARGYVTKRDSSRKIILAIREVLAGKLFVSEEMKTVLAEKFIVGGAASHDVGQLSDRELEVFRLLGLGNDTRDIAVNLGISLKTVQVYCARIKEKFHLETHTELLREAFRWVSSHPAM